MSRWRTLFLLALLAILAALLLGFVNFANSVHRLKAPDPPPRVQAIVALTGGSLERLRTGVRLLEGGYGQRLLITGVNPAATDQDIVSALGVDAARFDCCVDLGRSASDTIGNAAETAAWANAHEFRDILLVTEDYHMARSLIELRLALPRARITAYPVPSRLAQPDVWRSDPHQAARLGAEYLKLLAIQAREALIGADGQPVGGS